MMNHVRILRARLMEGVSKLKNLPRSLMEAFMALAKEGETSPVRVTARRKDKETY